MASDDDYDVISNPGLDSSIADLMTASQIYEPRPSEAARNKLSTVNLSAEEIQLYVRQHCHAEPRLVRVYVDGVFDGLSAASALQLRQAKLSFPAVHLMVGVFSDEQCQVHGTMPSAPHIERCELVRHCRWVDEIVEDAPWQTDEHLLRQKQIDFVAVEEGITVDPQCHKVRLRGYDTLKKLGIQSSRLLQFLVPYNLQARRFL